MKTRSHLLLLFLFIALTFQRSYGQSYGLGFFSHEVVQDKRTGLDLSPGKSFCFNKNFELSFDLSFLPKQEDYFGYIVRFVVGDQENIDLIYDKNLKELKHFKVITGDKFSKIAFNIPPAQLFNTWTRLKIRFDFEKNTLTLISGKNSWQTPVALNKKACFKILFGANEYRGFKTADIPPMKIREVQLAEQGQLKYHWPLDENNGETAKEKQNGSAGSVINPLWIEKMHYEWQLLKTVTANGPASVVFDAEKEIVNIVGNDSLKSYAIGDHKLSKVAYAAKLNLLRGNHSIYDNHNRLINICTDQKSVSIFNPETRAWSKNFELPDPITNYWQFNKFYSSADSSIYILGGYGHFYYKNDVQQYRFSSDNWSQVKVTGDVFTPRYLAALGFDGQGAYILGGYGSTTGKQMLNPRNLYDLMYFDVKKKVFKKIYELKIKGEDFVFANSLVIDEKTKSFYGLVFPKHKYNSELQLIEGSLEKPEFKRLASKIPYLFHDINSFSDLYYCASSKQFIAVTTFRDENDKTTVNIYSLYNSPLPVPAQLAGSAGHISWYYITGVLFIILLAAGIFKYRKSRKGKVIPVAGPIHPAMETTQPVVPASAAPQAVVIPVAPEQKQRIKSSVFLFGDLQVFDNSGNEITRQFTPLIKELFLVILLYTIRWERGISFEKLKELLWFGKSTESARNNRSVNIAKLKGILENMDGCDISNDSGYWRLSINPQSTYVDYQDYVNIIKDKKKLDKDKILQLAGIIKRGAFLSIVNYEWMDAFKAEVSNEIIDTYLHFAHSVKLTEDPELLIELANYIFYFDAVNEEAMAIKCRALVHLGKHSLAKNTFENFSKEYKLLYNDDFYKSFNEVLQGYVPNP